MYTRILPTCILIIGIGIVFFYFSHEEKAYDTSSALKNKEYWTEALARKDAQAVYKTFVNKNALLPASEQHLGAHIFGELLYNTKGIEGFTICNSEFGFGCYHGFFGRAISEQGEDVITALDAKCITAYGPLGTGCQHGIGHGILEYTGYQNLQAALALCDKTTRVSSLLGCVSGVFMEYHTPLAGVGNGLVPSNRPYDPSKPLDPCDRVGARYQSSCYFELGAWRASGQTSPVEVRATCNAVPDPYKKYCGLGVGYAIGFREQYDTGAALAACAAIFGDDALSCHAGVAWTMYATPEQRSKVQEACAYPKESEERACITLADLTEGAGTFPLH